MSTEPARTQGYLLNLYMARAGLRTHDELASLLGIHRVTVGSMLRDSRAASTKELGVLGEVLKLTKAEADELSRAAVELARG